jgi:flavin reductase (DIM6/NTAB) family NADH-FMN oxidoreductase RutF
LNNITIGQAYQLTSPNPFGLVLSRDDNGKVNVMGVSWWTYVSGNPPMLLACISKKSYTSSNIQRSNEFCLCLPDANIKDTAWGCSTTSGRNIDKLEFFNIETENSSCISVPVLKDSHVAFECRVKQIIDAGDHCIFLSDIAEIHANENKKHLYANNGYKELVEL